MKTIEKITLVLFSSLTLILSVFVCLVIFGWLSVDAIGDIATVLTTDPVTSKIILAFAIIFILLAIKCIGKLLITKETIENLVKAVVKGFDSAEDVTTSVELDNENNLRVFVNLTVKENAVIKELSSNLQTKIKETIKQSSDLDVKEVNIKVKNIEQTKDNTIEG